MVGRSKPLTAQELRELLRPFCDVLHTSLEKSPNRFAREHILATAVNVYGG